MRRADPWAPDGATGGQDLLLNAPASAPDDHEDLLDFRKYFAALRRHWLLPLVCVLITVSYALVQYTLTTKQYRASATIQIERKRLSVMALGGQGAWLEDWWNMEYYPTQYRLLRSRGMAERVVKNLRLYENSAFTGRPANVDWEGDESPAQVSDAELSQLAARVRSGLSVNPIKSTQLVELSYVSANPELAAQLANAYAEAFIEWGVETRSSTVVQASSFLTRQIETLREEIEDRQKMLNTIISESDFALDPAGEALLKRRQVLESQYNSVIVERLQSDAAYQEIRGLPPEIVANRTSPEKLSKIKTEIFTLESDYESKLNVYRPEWPEMKKLQEEIDERREHLEREVQDAYEQAKNQAYGQYQQARLREEALEQQLKKLADNARLQNSAALDYNNQTTYINTRKELLSELVKRQSETEVASRVQDTQESNIRIVDHAIIPSTAFRPTLKRSLIAAILIGLGLGVGGIVVLEFLDRTIKSPEELESILGYPTLTVIPDMADRGRGAGLRYRYGRLGYGYSYSYGYGYSSEPATSSTKAWKRTARKGTDKSDEPDAIELLPFHNPRLAVCEAYRSLRTALLLSTAEELKAIAVTSAEPSEGKTATVSNLGVVLAQLDRRVLIIDADLRRPRQHKVFKLTNRLGLVNYLTSRVDLDSIVRTTEVPNLYVCTAGPIPPNPSELLAADRLREVLDTVRSRFDFVLLDSPPVLPVADAVILGSLVDGIVICARAGVLQREDAKHCGERLRYAGLKILGTVLNRYRSTTASPYSRRYRYYGGDDEAGSPSRADSAA